MSSINRYGVFFILVMINLFCCTQPYNPPNIKGNYNYLVVDGIVINGPTQTVINLSRSQNINDSSYYTLIPETGAIINVVGSLGDTYALQEQGAGAYVADSLNLNPGETYQIKIVTANGSQYQSDSSTLSSSPPIDTVNWQLTSNGLQIYVNTHDPLNNTHFYLWQYAETWEYHSAYDASFEYVNQLVVPRDSAQRVYKCWQSDQSTNLIIGSSAKLQQDIIYEQPLVFIPSSSEKLGVEYSILVKQFALTEKAYNFWQTLQKNTEQLGSLFDAQPSQLTGNVHNLSNPNEPVLGFVSFSSLQQQRIFIYNSELSTWGYNHLACEEIVVVNNPDSFAFYYGAGYIPVSEDYPPSGFVGYYSALSSCVDCTLHGGTTLKPSFWP